MIRLTCSSIERFGVMCTLKLMLMVAFIVGASIAVVASNPEPKPVNMERCIVTTLDVPTGTTTREMVRCGSQP
jgi:hypothetical protein